MALKLLTSLKSFHPQCQTGFSSASFWDVHSVTPPSAGLHVTPKVQLTIQCSLNSRLMEAVKLLWTHPHMYTLSGVSHCQNLLQDLNEDVIKNKTPGYKIFWVKIKSFDFKLF